MKRLVWRGRGAWAASAVAAVAAVAALGGCTTLLGVDEKYHGVQGGGGTGAAGATGVAKLGEPCMEVQQLACAGNAQSLKLICETDHTWQKNNTCDGDTLCDATVQPGTCKPVVAECAGKSAGDVVCTGVTRAACGPDLVTTEVVETCSKACLSEQCTECVPLTDKQCAGNLPQSCDANGAWQDGAACSGYCAGGACIATPSCTNLEMTCGADGNESCCASSVVAGGTYNRGNDAAYPAKVSDFRLDRFEITVGRFRKFVASYPVNKPAAGAGAHPLIAESGWQAGWNASLAVDQAALKTAVKCNATFQTWTDTASGNESKPMNCINWHEAFAFCAWDGGRLATEAEWNYAAAGGSEQRQYPWSNSPTSTMIDSTYAVYDGAGIIGVGSKSPKGDGKWEQADLAGSVWEWTLDWYGDPYITPCSDCAILSQGTALSRAIRGGGWSSASSDLLSSVSLSSGPTLHVYYIGTRCARTP